MSIDICGFYLLSYHMVSVTIELMAERTKAGLAAAKAKGRVGGRKRKMTQSKIDSAKQLLANGTLPKDVAENLGISVPTLYRWVPASNNVT
jgi:DNA invertase Pin-like site-specific DNA recombinase